MKRASITRPMSGFRIPAGALAIVKEVARLVIRRPVVGVVSAARTPDGRWLLIRRADVGDWALPGGTLEWGETVRELIPRELREEAGVEVRSIGRLVGVFSRPDRDPRFHGVTITVQCEVDMPTRPPQNFLEIQEVGLFADADLPTDLSMGTGDMLTAARQPREPIVE